jgi:hypothetical protein
MAKYRVKPRVAYGPRNEYKPGDIVELTPEEAAGFLDKLEPVEQTQAVKFRPPAGLRNDLNMKIDPKDKILSEEQTFRINEPESVSESVDDGPAEVGPPKKRTQRKKNQ